MRRRNNGFKKYLSLFMILAMLAGYMPAFAEDSHATDPLITQGTHELAPLRSEHTTGTSLSIQTETTTPSFVQSELSVNYTEGTDQPLMESLKVSDNDSFLDCTASLPENVRLDHVNNSDGLVSWNFCLEPGAASGVYVVPIDFLFHHPQGPDSNDYQGTLNLNIHYMDTAEAPSNNNAKASETLSLSNGTFHIYTTDQTPVAGCTLNLPEGFSITPGAMSVVGPGTYGWSAKILQGTPSGDYSVPISAYWKSRDLSDTGHFEFSIPINYTAPVVPSGETVYQITEAGKDYYLVGFGDALPPPAAKTDIQTMAAMSEFESQDAFNPTAAVEMDTQSEETPVTSVPFALVVDSGASSGTVYKYLEGKTTPWQKTNKTLQVPDASNSIARASSVKAAATQPYNFPKLFNIKKLHLETFRAQILEQVVAALNDNGILIPDEEMANLKAGVFHGVDRYAFGDLVIISTKLNVRTNEASAYYLYARHMTGLALNSWMASKHYKGSQNAYDALGSVNFLNQCGFVTPEAVLSTVTGKGRLFNPEEFFIVGSIGQGLGMDYLGVSQLMPSLKHLKSDYKTLNSAAYRNKWIRTAHPFPMKDVQKILTGFIEGLWESVKANAELIGESVTTIRKGMDYVLNNPPGTILAEIQKDLKESWNSAKATTKAIIEFVANVSKAGTPENLAVQQIISDLLDSPTEEQAKMVGMVTGEVIIAVLVTKGAGRLKELVKSGEFANTAVKSVKAWERMKALMNSATESLLNNVRALSNVGDSFQVVTPDGISLRMGMDQIDSDKQSKIQNLIAYFGKSGSYLDEKIEDALTGDHFVKVNKIKSLRPSIVYTTLGGHTYRTDIYGRIISVSGKLELKIAGRSNYWQRVAGRSDRLPSDEGGHLIADMFNGSGNLDNLVAMDKALNTNGGKWYKMEQEWKKAIQAGRKVEVSIDVIYEGNSKRPSRFDIEYKIDGKHDAYSWPNANGGNE